MKPPAGDTLALDTRHVTARVVGAGVAMVLFWTAVLMAGCAGFTSRPALNSLRTDELIASNDRFLLIRSRPGDSFSALAERVYGSGADGHRLQAINAPLVADGGGLVAVPKRVLNPSGVYRRGYRTIPILSYHQFTARSQASSRLQQTAAGFRAQLRYLRDHGYQVLRLSRLPEYLNGEREIPPRSVVITIDDGFRSAFEVAYPLLAEYGYPATLFVYTDFVGTPASLSWQQMQTMLASGLIDIQSHGKSHRSLLAPPGDGDYQRWLMAEVGGAQRILQRRLGHRVELFSYPYGDSNEAAVKLLKRQGFSLAATVQRGGNPSFSDPYRLRRTMVYSDDDLDDFERKLEVQIPFRYR